MDINSRSLHTRAFELRATAFASRGAYGEARERRAVEKCRYPEKKITRLYDAVEVAKSPSLSSRIPSLPVYPEIRVLCVPQLEANCTPRGCLARRALRV